MPSSGSEQSAINDFVLVRSGHHGNFWLAVIGELDQVQPTLLRYLNRPWGQEIADKAPGIRCLPNRMHLSLGKVITGDLHMAVITLGCKVFMYIILSCAQRAELHSAYNVVVCKNRKTRGVVMQHLQWHNRIEGFLQIRLDSTTDAHCDASAMTSATAAACDASIAPAMFSGGDGDAKAKSERKNKKLWSDADLVLPCFATDYIAKISEWEKSIKDKAPTDLFLVGEALFLVVNPQLSLPKCERDEGSEMSLDPVSSPTSADSEREHGLNYYS